MRIPTANSTLTAVLVLCALITTSLVVRRELFIGYSTAAPQRATFVPDWRRALTKGIPLGLPDAPVQLIEFADFQCPYCRSFYQVLNAVQQRYPKKIALTFIHLPLESHKFAEPAARAADCAADQGRFQELYDYLFQNTETLGQIDVTQLAQAAKVKDVARFDACARNEAPVPRIVEGKQLAEAFNVAGTPTLLLNGWKLTASPTSKQLGEMIEAVLQGKPPVADSTRLSHDGG